MGFKEFFSFNIQRIILTIFLIVFASLPFFVVAFGGFAPPILILLMIPALISQSNFLMLSLLAILFPLGV